MTNSPLVIELEVSAPTVQLEVEPVPALDLSAVDGQRVTMVAGVGAPGPQGEPGPPGPAFDGTAFWYGEGAPTTVIGSKAGDYYINTINGDLYELS